VFNYLLYRLGQLIALNLPLKLAYGFAKTVANFRYMFAFADRNAVDANLRAIFPLKSNKEIQDIKKLMFQNFAKYLVDFFRYEKIDEDYISKNIRLENFGNFQGALDKGKGVVILTAHLGNWELGGVVIAVMGIPFWVVALPHKNKLVDKFFNTQRSMKNIKVIPLGKAVRQCLDVLRANEAVALVGDRDFSEKGIILDFFGKPTHFPEGPAAFALKTGAQIVPGFMLRKPDDTFILKIERPLEFTVTGDKEKDIKEIITKYIAIFEDYIRTYPDQWYVFRKFWID